MSKQTFTTGQVLTAQQVNDLQSNDFNQTVSVKTANYTLVVADRGTRVVMNAAGSTSITVNTSIFTAGDTLAIHNINSGVCTVTAGTATVNTSGSLALAQYQGGVLYFTSASDAIFFQFATPASGDITGITTSTDSGLSGGVSSGNATLRLKVEFDAETGTTYTLLAANLNQLVTLSNASAITLTVPPSVFSAGDIINIAQIGAGQVTLAQGAGVTITSTGATASAPKLRAQHSAASIICTASNTFLVVGDLA